MLTVEKLNAEKSLEGLSDEQKKAIEQLSKNDEQITVDQAVGKAYRSVDDKVRELTGSDKPHGKYTSDWVGEQLLKFKEKADSVTGLNERIDSLTTENDDLKKKVKSGATDEALKGRVTELEGKLKDEQDLVTTLRGQITENSETHKAELEKLAKAEEATKKSSMWTAAQTGFKFKDEKIIDPEVRRAMIAQKISGIESEYTIDFGSNSGDDPVFRDKEGQIVRNPDNKNNPYTPEELLAKRIAPILQEGRKVGGSGGSGNPGGGSGGAFSLNGAKSKREAHELIAKHLVESEGLVRGTQAFTQRQVELAKEHVPADLPL